VSEDTNRAGTTLQVLVPGEEIPGLILGADDGECVTQKGCNLRRLNQTTKETYAPRHWRLIDEEIETCGETKRNIINDPTLLTIISI